MMFVKEADAFVLFPGGFGTFDELFELLTLSQTGKSDLHPVVMLEPAGDDYWPSIDRQLKDVLMTRGYHSQRYVEGKLIFRLNREISDAAITALNNEFRDILLAPIERAAASPSERQDEDVPELPRLRLHFHRVHYGRLRQLIDRLNEVDDNSKP